MVTLNWAMAVAYHDVFRKQPSVRREDLDVSRVRNKFESDLRLIQADRIPTWTDADRILIEKYFESTSGQ